MLQADDDPENQPGGSSTVGQVATAAGGDHPIRRLPGRLPLRADEVERVAEGCPDGAAGTGEGVG
jgi:hypothetical protein